MNPLANHHSISKENRPLAGKYPTQWVKSDTIRTKVNFDFKSGGTQCQVADVAFNSKAFDIIEA
jgi:hypothetical protein